MSDLTKITNKCLVHNVHVCVTNWVLNYTLTIHQKKLQVFPLPCRTDSGNIHSCRIAIASFAPLCHIKENIEVQYN